MISALHVDATAFEIRAMDNTSDLLTFDQIAAMAGVSKRTVSEWCSSRRHISRRLRVIRISRKTVRVRNADWMKFQETLSK